ncbi:glycosyltransferase family 61 protein [Acetobacter persici]|uniref:glycosyltransferase family 61 protein n=1 Tax=Acetobacter persici TaxID=1076596 RepID=UPI0039EB2ECC
MSETTPQDAFSVANGLSAFGKISEQKAFQTNAQILPLPIPAYDGQSEQTFNRGLSLYHARPVAGTRTVSVPLTRLSLFTMENARFVLYPGLDGMIIDNKNHPVIEPSCFCQHDLYQHNRRLPDMPEHEEQEEVFLGFDAAWRNYYHWMLYGISKTQIASTLLPAHTRFVVPDMPKAGATHHPAFTPETFETSLRLSGLQDRVFRAPEGVHRARKLHFFWHTPTMPELYLNFSEPHKHFDAMTVPHRPDLPTRFYVTREGGHNSRISPEEQAQIEPVLERKGFEKVFLEKMDLETQIALFRQAECILAPHGAGLANMVFARPGTRLLELNRKLDGQPHLRNCFYIITLQRKQPYMVLDLDDQPLTSEMLDNALIRLENAPDPF